jgi:hypothetical protein
MQQRIKHNQVIVYVINQEETAYEIVLVSLDVSYSLGSVASVKAASNLIVHSPDFLDRHYAPLWCSYDGQYIKTRDVKLGL